jgi:hypothetical protein
MSAQVAVEDQKGGGELVFHDLGAYARMNDDDPRCAVDQVDTLDSLEAEDFGDS